MKKNFIILLSFLSLLFSSCAIYDTASIEWYSYDGKLLKQWKDALIIRDNRGRVEYFKDNYGTWQYLEGGTVHVYGFNQHIDENFY